MNKVILIFIFFFLISCATPKVVTIKDPFDDKKNCKELENSVAEAQNLKGMLCSKKKILEGIWQE